MNVSWRSCRTATVSSAARWWRPGTATSTGSRTSGSNLEACGPLDIERGDREVDLASRGHREHVAGGVLAQRHVDPGMGSVKRGDQPGQVQPGECLHGAEHQPSGGKALERGDLLARGIHLRQGAASPQEKDLARLGQAHPAARALEQLDAEFLL